MLVLPPFDQSERSGHLQREISIKALRPVHCSSGDCFGSGHHSLIQNELADCGDIAVFTAMCMCWSGYLSTHVSMMDLLGETRFTGKAILSHTLGGIVAGMSAHWFYTFFYLLQ